MTSKGSIESKGGDKVLFSQVQWWFFRCLFVEAEADTVEGLAASTSLLENYVSNCISRYLSHQSVAVLVPSPSLASLFIRVRDATSNVMKNSRDAGKRNV